MTANALKHKRILITCGPTWVAIDDMRVISNRSTGSLGHILAKQLIKSSAGVTLLEGPVTNPLKVKGITVKKFHYFDELAELLKIEANRHDIIIHAAAVSDYRLKQESPVKLSSKLKKLSLDLVPTEKLINQIKSYNPKVTLVGFKLETKVIQANVKALTENLYKKAGCDFVIANCSTEKVYKAFLLNRDGRIIAKAIDRKTITAELVKALKA